MRCAGVLLALLFSLSALSASTAEAHKRRLSDNAALLTGRKLFRGRKIMAAPEHGDSMKHDEVMEGKGAKSTGANTVHVHEEEKTVEVSVVGLSGESAGRANPEADASSETVHEEGKRSKGPTHAMFPQPRQSDAAATAPELFSMDYNAKLPARHHRPINNDAPLDVLAKKP
ncbi:hypothetical protein EJB05_43419, partial [Eragrostis curvula]